MNEFSSLKFSKLYMNSDLPGSCKLYMLQLTEASMNMFNAVEECVDLINNNGGFTVLVGWYKKGLINDKSLMTTQALNNNTTNSGNYNNNDQVQQVDSGDVSYHIVSISPTNRDFLDHTTHLGIQLISKKFNEIQLQILQHKIEKMHLLFEA